MKEYGFHDSHTNCGGKLASSLCPYNLGLRLSVTLVPLILNQNPVEESSSECSQLYNGDERCTLDDCKRMIVAVDDDENGSALFVSWSPASATRVSDQRLRHDVADSCSFEGRAIDRSGCRYVVRFYVARLIAAVVAMLFVSVSLATKYLLLTYICSCVLGFRQKRG
ncbi:hypothetical protein YC2023_013112 [Brassica napus]